MKLYSFDIPNSHYEHTFDSEEYEKAPDKDGFCFTGPFVYWEDHKQALARITELEKALRTAVAYVKQNQGGWCSPEYGVVVTSEEIVESFELMGT